MNSQSKNLKRVSTLGRAAACALEGLEGRVLMSTSSVVLGTPTNLSASTAGVTPQFDWLAPLVTGSSDADLIVANSGSSIGVLTNKRDNTGTFNNAVTYSVAGTPLPITTGALIDGSATQDIVVGTTGSPGGISILIGNGDATFQPAINHTALGSNHAIAIGNFGDGHAAIVTADNTSSTSNNLAICYTDGAGHITAVDPIPVGHGGIAAIAVGTFTNSGFQDIAILSQTDGTVTLLRGNGNGTFQAPVDFKTGASPTSLAVGDFNGDGKQDIVTANSTAGTVSFLAGSGTGTFAAKLDTAVTGSAVGGGPLKVRVANFANNGKADLLCLLSPGSSGDATILLGQGNGTFQNISPITTHGATRSGLAVGNLNGDSLTDIVLSDPSQITTLRNITNSDNSTPVATLDANPAQGSSQSSIYQFTVTYTDSQQVDGQTLGDGNIIVTAPAGVTFPGNNTQEAATLVSTNVTSGATVHATYQISFGSNLTQADAGAYGVAMASGAGAVTNAGGIPVTAGTFGTLNLTVVTTNATPPTASVAATQAPGSQQGNFYQFNVSYSSTSSQINAVSLGSDDVTVTAPNGIVFANGTNTQVASLITQNLTNASTVVATYQVSFPSNLSSSTVGAYAVSVNANSVTDIANIPVAAGSIGSFNLSLASNIPAPTGDFTPSAPKGKFKASVVSGSKQGGVTVTIVNTSNKVLTGKVVVTLHSSLTQIVDSTATSLTSITHAVKKLKHGKGFVVHFKPFAYPATAGTYYLVADATLNGTADSYDGSTATPIGVAAAFVDARANSLTPTKAVITAGKKNTAVLSVTNIGNVTMKAPGSSVSVYASTTGVLDGSQTLIATVPLNLTLTASQTKKVTLGYIPSTLPTAGTYHLIATVNITADGSTGNNTVATVGTVTI